MEPADDLELLDRWRAGDGAAGNALFKRHFEAIYRFFERKVEGEVDELVQDVFLACLRGRDTFRKQSSFRTYLFAVARFTLYGYWRRLASHGQSLNVEEISVASLTTSLGTRMAQREDRVLLLQALRELPLDQQLLLELHYWEGLQGVQLAEVFGIEEATTRSRLFRARQALRERLEAAGARGLPKPPDNDSFDAWAKSLRSESDPAGESNGNPP